MAFRGDIVTGPKAAWLDSLVVDHAVFRLAWTNAAPMLPGRLYRSNHPTPGQLAVAMSMPAALWNKLTLRSPMMPVVTKQ